jgi:hypothetical protein
LKQVQLTASSSRVIAFVGMIGILAHLLGGMTLFAPYIVNRFSPVFASR